VDFQKGVTAQQSGIRRGRSLGLKIVRDGLVWSCYDWKLGNLKLGTWAVHLGEELDKMGLGYVAKWAGEGCKDSILNY